MSTDEKRPIRVMVCEDHVIVREGLVSLLEAHDDFEVIAEAGDGEAALQLFRRQPPDVTLMDLRMPQLDGVEVIRTLRREYPGSRFLVLTTYDTERRHHPRPASRRQRLPAQGHQPRHPARRHPPGARRPPLHPARDRRPGDPRRRRRGAHRARGGGPPPHRRRPEQREIGDQLGISESTVKTHVNHLLGKLGVTDRTKALVLALKRGLVHIE
jgi:CheY-like chemotaxis protein